jgi:phage shock protein PspC (stress-responsive transcriptional regulator)
VIDNQSKRSNLPTKNVFTVGKPHVCGVCRPGQYFGIDPTVVRLIFVLGTPA